MHPKAEGGLVTFTKHPEEQKFNPKLSPSHPVDLKTRKSIGTSCPIEIYFSIQIIKFLVKYNLLCL